MLEKKAMFIFVNKTIKAPPPNAIYWDLFTPKGQDGAGSGNLKGTNVSALTVGKTYAIQGNNNTERRWNIRGHTC